MLNNRITRLITTVLLLIGAIVLYFLIIQPLFGEWTLSIVAGGITISCVVSLVNQFFWDVLNFGFMENKVGMVIRDIFYFFITIFCFAIMASQWGLPTSGGMPAIEDLNFLEYGIMAGCTLAPVVTCVIWLVYPVFNDERELCPFFGVAGVVGSILVTSLLHLILGGIEGFAVGFVNIVFLILGIGIVGFCILVACPFSDRIIAGGSIIRFMDGRSSGRKTTTTTSGGYSDPLLNAMKSVADMNSGSYSVRYATVYVRVSVTISGSDINFRIGGSCRLSSNCPSSDCARTAGADARAKVDEIKSDILAGADSMIDATRESYPTKYNRDYTIHVYEDTFKVE